MNASLQPEVHVEDSGHSNSPLLMPCDPNSCRLTDPPMLPGAQQRTEALSYSDSHCKNGCLLWVVGAAVVGRAVVEGQQLGCMLLPQHLSVLGQAAA